MVTIYRLFQVLTCLERKSRIFVLHNCAYSYNTHRSLAISFIKMGSLIKIVAIGV